MEKNTENLEQKDKFGFEEFEAFLDEKKTLLKSNNGSYFIYDKNELSEFVSSKNKSNINHYGIEENLEHLSTFRPIIIGSPTHHECIFLYKRKEMLYVIPLNEEGTSHAKMDSIFFKENTKYPKQMIKIVNNTQEMLQADGVSCHYYADLVQRYAADPLNIEKTKNFLEIVEDWHNKNYEKILKNEDVEGLTIDNTMPYYSGYVKYGQRFNSLSENEKGNISPRMVVNNLSENNKQQNFTITYHELLDFTLKHVPKSFAKLTNFVADKLKSDDKNKTP